MPGNPARFMSVEKLLEHGPSLRRLALDLARDEAGAEDLVQETWMVALRREPPAWAEPGPWLRGVLRNVFRGTRRGEHRRQRREALASKREAAQDPAPGLIERAEILRRIVGHVLELDPIYREAILLRYLEDLSPAEVAERIGAPVDTVHTRLRRGIEKLRRSLDDAHRGGRRGWALVLLPTVPSPAGNFPGCGPVLPLARASSKVAAALGTLAMSMKTAVPVVVLAAALLGLGAIALLPERGPQSTSTLEPGTERLPVASVGRASTEARPSLDGAKEADPGTDAHASPGGAELVVAVRGPGGDAIAGAALEAVRIDVEPGTLAQRKKTASRGTSESDGEFRFQGLEPGTYEVRAISPEHRPGHSDEIELWKGAAVDIEIELAEGLCMEGIVLDPAGRPVPGAVVMSSEARDWIGPNFAVWMGESDDLSWAAAELRTRTDAQGRFRLARLPSGNRTLMVRHPDWAPAERGPVAAGSRGIEIRLEVGASIRGRVRDTTDGLADGAVVRAFVSSHHALAEDMRAGFAARTDASGAFHLEKAPRESLRITARLADGREETRDVDVPDRGDLAGIEIVVPAAATVRGRVMSSTGIPVGGAAISLVEMTELGRRLQAVSLEDGSFVVSGVRADILCDLSVRSPGRPPLQTRFRSDLEIDLGDLVLEDGLAVAGSVVSSEGAPVPGCRVWIGKRHGEAWHSSEVPRRTDADGRFSFDGLLPGTYGVKASAPGFLRGECPEFTLGLHVDPPQPQVVLAQGEPALRGKAALAGRVRDGEGGHAIGAFQVFLGHESARSRGRGHIFMDPEGRFTIDELEPGERTVRIFARGYTSHEARISLEPGETKTVLADLATGSSISGRLIDASGQPVAGARAFTVSDEEARQHRPQGTTTAYVHAEGGLTSAVTFDAGLPDEAQSGEDGAFLLEGLRSGRTLLRIDHPRFPKRILDPIEVPAQGMVSLGDIRLESGAAIEGIVHDVEGKPVRGGSVHVQPMGDGGPVETYVYVPIGADGSYRKEGLQPGRAWIRIYGIEETGREVELELGSTLRADFRIPATE